MAKPKQFTERVLASTGKARCARLIEPLLADDEDRADLIREAVEREIQRRERELRRVQK